MSGVAERIHEALRRLLASEPAEAGPLVLASSGGLDSTVLAHVLRFRTRPRPTVVLAHFDHAMRAGSAGDAAWLRGLGLAWGLELRVARAPEPPASEAEARQARYAFLDEVRRAEGARWVLTAHHADDQAETVLFRALRGTGLDGLRGMEERRPPGLVRPMLSLWRDELVAYAQAVGLGWREDPSNLVSGYARNVIRNEILPLAEARVAPGARRSLVRLADLARRDAEAWGEVLDGLLPRLGLGEGKGDAPDLDAGSVAALGPALRARVLRRLAADAGVALDERTTARAVDFVADAVSGRGIQLGGGFELRRELDRLRIVREDVPTADERLVIEDPGPGAGTARLGGRELRVRWWPGEEPAAAGSRRVVLPLARVAFPLVVRARVPGDRVDVWGGPRRVKRLLLDAGVPSRERGGVPVLADAEGRVLWVAGVAEREEPRKKGEDTMTIAVVETGRET